MKSLNFGKCLVAVLLLINAACGNASAAPFSGKSDLNIIGMTIPVPGQTIDLIATVKGESTLMGRFNGWVSYTFDPSTLEFVGKAVKVAANGDLISEDVTGAFTDYSLTQSSGNLTITGGTGKFKGATGSAEYSVQFSSATQGVITFAGACDYSASNRAKSPSANTSDFNATGQVIFKNIQQGVFGNELVPYVGVSSSELTGLAVQTGTIKRTTTPTFVALGKLQFSGEVGPHPVLGTNVHVISTAKGDIYVTWTAEFTVQFTSESTVVFSGDAEFDVQGGTGIYQNAKGKFQTLFQTEEIAANSDSASASVTQTGSISR
jgi:hypothetical protein